MGYNAETERIKRQFQLLSPLYATLLPLVERIACRTEISKEVIMNTKKNRRDRVVLIRRAIIYFIKTSVAPYETLSSIGQAFCMDHSTIVYHLQEIAIMIERKDKKFAEFFEVVKEEAKLCDFSHSDSKRSFRPCCNNCDHYEPDHHFCGYVTKIEKEISVEPRKCGPDFSCTFHTYNNGLQK